MDVVVHDHHVLGDGVVHRYYLNAILLRLAKLRNLLQQLRLIGRWHFKILRLGLLDCALGWIGRLLT